MPQMKFQYDIFLGHGAADSSFAKRLYHYLSARCRVFLDLETLIPGDRWQEEVPKAQKSSLMSVLIISHDSGSSYYEQEEIAAAIELSKDKDSEHRVVPLFLHPPESLRDVPYGLRRIHGIVKKKKTSTRMIAEGLIDLVEAVKKKYIGVPQTLEEDYLNAEESYLTGDNTRLGDRLDFEKLVNKLIMRHLRTAYVASVVYVDLDDLTKINKWHGESVGDEVIKAVNALFFEATHKYPAIKWGTDEFLCCYHNLPNRDVIRLAEQLRRQVREFAWDSLSPGLHVTASCGVAQYKHGEMARDWILRAILGCQAAKRGGGDMVLPGPQYLPQHVNRDYEFYDS
jgi:diguanylate cyclase (GGDEF)-like protein